MFTRTLAILAVSLLLALAGVCFALLTVTLPSTTFSTPCNQECQYIREYHYVERVYQECLNQHVFNDYTCSKIANAIVTGVGY